MRGCFERREAEDGNSRRGFAGQGGDCFNVKRSREVLSQMQYATESASFLVVVVIVSRVRRLDLKVRAAASHQRFWPDRRAMMVMQRPRTDVDHEVSGQGGDGNQGAAPKNHHWTVREQLDSSTPSQERNRVTSVGITKLYRV